MLLVKKIGLECNRARKCKKVQSSTAFSYLFVNP